MSTNRVILLREYKTATGVLVRITLRIDGRVSEEIDRLIDELAAKLPDTTS